MNSLPVSLVGFPREFDLSRVSQAHVSFFPQGHVLVRRGTLLSREELVDLGDFRSRGPVLTHMQTLHILKVHACTPACTGNWSSSRSCEIPDASWGKGRWQTPSVLVCGHGELPPLEAVSLPFSVISSFTSSFSSSYFKVAHLGMLPWEL